MLSNVLANEHRPRCPPVGGEDQTRRKKDGRTHDYWSVVENKRVAGWDVVQRHVLWLGEINHALLAGCGVAKGHRVFRRRCGTSADTGAVPRRSMLWGGVRCVVRSALPAGLAAVSYSGSGPSARDAKSQGTRWNQLRAGRHGILPRRADEARRCTGQNTTRPRYSPLLRYSCLQIADEKACRALPCLVRVAAETEYAAKDTLAGRDVDNAEAKAADQCADLIDPTD
jgi:hypothetical protein